MRFSFDKIFHDLDQMKPLPVASKDQHADIGTQAVDAQVWNCHVFSPSHTAVFFWSG